eukprot:g73925.t1
MSPTLAPTQTQTSYRYRYLWFVCDPSLVPLTDVFSSSRAMLDSSGFVGLLELIAVTRSCRNPTTRQRSFGADP